jgi:hypothetical protein
MNCTMKAFVLSAIGSLFFLSGCGLNSGTTTAAATYSSTPQSNAAACSPNPSQCSPLPIETVPSGWTTVQYCTAYPSNCDLTSTIAAYCLAYPYFCSSTTTTTTLPYAYYNNNGVSCTTTAVSTNVPLNGTVQLQVSIYSGQYGSNTYALQSLSFNQQSIPAHITGGAGSNNLMATYTIPVGSVTGTQVFTPSIAFNASGINLGATTTISCSSATVYIGPPNIQYSGSTTADPSSDFASINLSLTTTGNYHLSGQLTSTDPSVSLSSYYVYVDDTQATVTSLTTQETTGLVLTITARDNSGSVLGSRSIPLKFQAPLNCQFNGPTIVKFSENASTGYHPYTYSVAAVDYQGNTDEGLAITSVKFSSDASGAATLLGMNGASFSMFWNDYAGTYNISPYSALTTSLQIKAVSTVDSNRTCTVTQAIQVIPNIPGAVEVPIYRLYSPIYGQHLYSTSATDGASGGFYLELSPAFNVYQTQISGTVPLYRCLYSGGNFANVYNCAGYTTIGLMGYIYQSAQPNTSPLYRCYNTAGDHLLPVADTSECTTHGYTVEGILGYVPNN